MTEDKIDRLKTVRTAIRNLQGISIPYNIIKDNMIPFCEWLDLEMKRLEIDG